MKGRDIMYEGVRPMIDHDVPIGDNESSVTTGSTSCCAGGERAKMVREEA